MKDNFKKNEEFIMKNMEELSLLKRRAREIYRQKLKDKKRQEFIGYIEETKKNKNDKAVSLKVIDFDDEWKI